MLWLETYLWTKRQWQNAIAKNGNTKNSHPNPKTPTPKPINQWRFIHWRFVWGIQTGYLGNKPETRFYHSNLYEPGPGSIKVQLNKYIFTYTLYYVNVSMYTHRHIVYVCIFWEIYDISICQTRILLAIQTGRPRAMSRIKAEAETVLLLVTLQIFSGSEQCVTNTLTDSSSYVNTVSECSKICIFYQ